MRARNPSPQLVFDQLPASFQADTAAGIDMLIQFDLTGEAGGKRWGRIADGKCTVGSRAVAGANLTLVVEATDYVKIRLGQLDPMEAYQAGKLKFRGQGSMPLAFRTLSLFKRRG